MIMVFVRSSMVIEPRGESATFFTVGSRVPALA